MKILEPLCHFYLHANPYETFSSYGKEKLTKTFVEKRTDLAKGYIPELNSYCSKLQDAIRYENFKKTGIEIKNWIHDKQKNHAEDVLDENVSDLERQLDHLNNYQDYDEDYHNQLKFGSITQRLILYI